MKRRSFIKLVGGTAGACALGVPEVIAAESSSEDIFPKRTLGRTGQRVSIIAFPGLALNGIEKQDECNKGVLKAFEKGINYFDVAPAYGNSEVKMGVALQAIDRSKIFLACKTKMRTAEDCRKEMERSLERLKTDHFDLYQIHHLVYPEDVKKVLGPGGAMEAVLKAREQGKIKYIGFSAHTTKAALEAIQGFDFDTVMFPINFVEYFNRGYGKEVIEAANKKGAAIVAIKPLSFGAWAQGKEKKRQWWYRTTETANEITMALRFTLSQPGVVTGIPPSFLDLLDKAMDVARAATQPITTEETAQLKEWAKDCGSIFINEENKVAMGHSPHSHAGPHPEYWEMA